MSRKPTIIAPEQGRHYLMGSLRAVFKADGTQTRQKYSVSEWWLEPRSRGPGVHQHADDHVFYVLEGDVWVQLAGEWQHATRGSYILIPGGTPHDFENRTGAQAGFISFNSPGGFEQHMPSIVEALTEEPVGDVPPERQ